MSKKTKRNSSNPPARSLAWRDYAFGYAFITPMLIGFIIFVLIPIIATFVLSFCDYSLLRGLKWCGLDNYIEIFTKDKTFVASVINTIEFTVLLIPTNLVLCLSLAMLLYKNMKGIGFFRTMIFTPYVTNIVSWGLIWKFMLQNDGGLINMILNLFGIQGTNWLYTPELAIPIVVLVTLLKGFGMNTIIFIGALQEVPEMYYEAAALDGASKWQQFKKITLPMISPTIFLIIIITMIGSLKVFSQVKVLTNGGPGTASYVMVYYIYQKAFKMNQFGYGAALSVLLFIVIMGLTIVQWNLRKRWIHYED